MRNLFLILLFSATSHAQWKSIKTTTINGERYETFQNPQGDQAVVKDRTPRSPDTVPEDATVQNLHLRQSMIEIGFGIGMEHFSNDSLLWNKNGVRGEFGQLFDGSPTVTAKSMGMQEAFVAFHPPVKILNRMTVGAGYLVNMVGGVDVTMTCPRPVLTLENINDCGEVLSAKNGWIPADGARVTYPRYAGNGTHSTGTNWYLFTDYDVWYIPAKKSLHAVSAGYNYGAQQNLHRADYEEIDGEVQKTHGFRIKYRWIRDSEYKVSFSNIFIMSTFDLKGGYRVAAGAAFGFGTPVATPKKKVK